MRPGACSPSAAMLVRLAILRGVVMNHTLDTFDVDASGSNICRHQCHAVAELETRESQSFRRRVVWWEWRVKESKATELELVTFEKKL